MLIVYGDFNPKRKRFVKPFCIFQRHSYTTMACRSSDFTCFFSNHVAVFVERNTMEKISAIKSNPVISPLVESWHPCIINFLISCKCPGDRRSFGSASGTFQAFNQVVIIINRNKLCGQIHINPEIAGV